MALKIVFMGTPEFAIPILNSIHKSDHKILSVYTQPPKKKFRGQKIISSAVQQLAEKLNLTVRCPEMLDNDKEYNFLKDLKPNVVVVVAYGKIIPKKILHLKGITFLNIHASILPKWRGAAPIQRAIMNLDKETGVSVMKVIPKLDSGPVMMKSKITISKNSNFEELSFKLSNLGAKLIIESLNLVEKKQEQFIEQNESEATYAKKVDKEEAKIIWREDAKKIIAKINAFHPNPGSWFKFNGSRLKIIKAIEVEATGEPGQIINKNFTIACSKNAVQILELQKEGKRKMKVSEFLKGNKLETNSKIL